MKLALMVIAACVFASSVTAKVHMNKGSEHISYSSLDEMLSERKLVTELASNRPTQDKQVASVGDAKVTTRNLKPVSNVTSTPKADPLRTMRRNVFTNETFRQNMNRLAKAWGFPKVFWDDSVKNCIWAQETEYAIPGDSGRDVLFFYAQTQGFHAVYSNVDNSVQLVYVGPQSRVKDCE